MENPGFTLLRFQKCSDSLKSDLGSHRQWIFLWGAAILILLFRLGTGSVSGSEGRWLAVAHEMIQSGDWLHPTINGEPYFDKPLVSYWLIALASAANHGIVSEFTARLPSALAAMLALGSVISIAGRLFSRQAAIVSGWIFLTCYSFFFWGRLAEADMENTAFIAAAVAWYLRCRETKSFGGYALFWTICAVGAQTKGLAAFVIPATAAGLDMILAGRFRFHFNLKSLAGFLFGMAVYLLPFLLESLSRGAYGASGIVLVFRENILRVFNPWDHKDEPFWIYFIHLPRLLIPWTPVFLLALWESFRRIRNRSLSRDEKWILLLIGLIFLLFTLSRSRRVYYILPAVPFCTVLCGWFLAGPGDGLPFRIVRILFRILDWLIPVVCLFCFALPFAFRAAAPRFFLPSSMMLPFPFVSWFYFRFPVAGACLLCFWGVMRFRARKSLPCFGLIPALPDADRAIPALWFGFFLIFSAFIPYVKWDPAFRSGRPFFVNAHRILFEEVGIPEENVAFFGGDYSYGVFYLNLPRKASMFGAEKIDRATRSLISDTIERGGPAEFAAFLEKIGREGGAVFGRWDAFENPALPPEIRTRFLAGSLHPVPGVIVEADTISDRRIREEAEADLMSGVEPDRSAAWKKLRKIMRKKMILLVVPPPSEKKPVPVR